MRRDWGGMRRARKAGAIRSWLIVAAVLAAATGGLVAWDRVRHSATLQGRVFFDGEPAAAMVGVVDSWGELNPRCWTDRDGSYELRGLPIGAADVVVTHVLGRASVPREVEWRLLPTSADLLSDPPPGASARIGLRAFARTNRDFPIERTELIRGEVVTSAGRAVHDARVTVSPESGPERWLGVPIDGQFKIQVPARRFARFDVTVQYYHLALRRTDVAPGASAGRFVVPPVGRLPIVVRGPDGQPVAECRFQWRSAGVDHWGADWGDGMAAPTEWLRSDASGRFVLRVPSGAIDLRVEPRPSRLAERVAQAIAVRPDESSPALEVEVGARDEPR